MKKRLSYMIKPLVNLFMILFFIATAIYIYLADKTEISISDIFNVSIGIVCMFGVAILGIIHSLEKTSNDNGGRLFYLLIVFTYIGLVFDNISWLIDGKIEYYRLNYISCLISFIVTPVMLIVFYDYQSIVLFSKFKNNIRRRIFVHTMMLLDLVYIAVASYNGFLFHFDEFCYYHNGKGMTFLYIFPALVIIISIFDVIRINIPLAKKLSLIAFVIAPVVSIIALYLFPEYSFEYVLLYFTLVLVYGTIQIQRNVDYVNREKEIAEQRARIAAQDKELSENQTQLMLSQLQPHFIYNTLGSIAALCDEDPKHAQEVTVKFSKYLRSNMDSLKDNGMLPFSDAWERTQTYLWIEKERFGDYLTVETDIKCRNFSVPTLTLQPIVENAVKHGATQNRHGGVVKISTVGNEDSYQIIVEDNGKGFDMTQIYADGKNHIGIANVERRLAIMCNGSLDIKSEIGAGTTATITIPKEKI